MMLSQQNDEFTAQHDAIVNAYRMDEAEAVSRLLSQLDFSPETKVSIDANAMRLVSQVREQRIGTGGMDAFLCEYDLSSQEGIALMCLAEALLRIPDSQTVDLLIRDKITTANWQAHKGHSPSMFVNAATWGLLLTGKLLADEDINANRLNHTLKKFFARGGMPMVRKMVGQAMKLLGNQFVMGQTIDAALKRARKAESVGYRYSYDMLGEAARTAEDAERYFQAYANAIEKIGQVKGGANVTESPGISVKLSALHPRYEFAKRERVMNELVPRLTQLALKAKAVQIGMTIDAEEADRLDLSLDIIERVFTNPLLSGWEGFGLAVQAYQKRAWYVLDGLAVLARSQKRRIMVRLVKGAYWDTEIKMAQVAGLSGYPVFTRKQSTDVSFLACAKRLLAEKDAFYPQFATHNAYCVAAILAMAGETKDYEFQCLHGMGQTLYDQMVGKKNLDVACRVYAPVGGHEELLAYLVRRLLENGANSSFVKQIIDPTLSIEEIIANPIEKIAQLTYKPHPHIPLPIDLYGQARQNSAGFDFSDATQFKVLCGQVDEACRQAWQAFPTVSGVESENDDVSRAIFDPAHQARIVGYVTESTPVELAEAFNRAAKVAHEWAATPVETRAALLEKFADLLAEHRASFLALAIHEAGKTFPDAIGEWREAVDFCRYYAAQARDLFAKPKIMPGPTGECNQLYLKGRGPMICISPWNFPLAIFTGQVVAAVVAGNPVMAKPSDQTPLIAALAVKLMHQAGIPEDVVQLLPCQGSVFGAHLLSDSRLQGVLFTGSTATARRIYQAMATSEGPIAPLIAETGGQNAMIVDSSALPEQVVVDVIASAFGSAGQRCSALRVLFVQEDIAPKILSMLKGAMAELVVGDPSLLSTDIGPVIDDRARHALQSHVDKMNAQGQLLYQVPLDPHLIEQGSFFAPCAFEIQHLSQLTEEVFGPILHIIRYPRDGLDDVINQINSTGYGLTLGIHSRIETTIQWICKRVQVGNVYVNRNMVGAVVGVQPFGGEGLSGTGPKAGGPHYLLRLSTEHTVCVNTTASGGNMALMSLGEG